MEVRDELRHLSVAGKIGYADAHDIDFPLWNTYAGTLRRNPKFYQTINAYADTLRGNHERVCFLYDYTLADWELAMRTNIATQIIIDASKLSEVLADDSQSDVTVIDVLQSVYTTLTKPEKDEEHYFSVQLDGVDTNSRLLSYADVEDYLTQNAPVPYSPDFVWGKEIVKRLQNEGLTISSYNISLEYGTRVATLYKPYRDEFIVDKGKNITDVVQDIQDRPETLLAIMYAFPAEGVKGDAATVVEKERPFQLS